MIIPTLLLHTCTWGHIVSCHVAASMCWSGLVYLWYTQPILGTKLVLVKGLTGNLTLNQLIKLVYSVIM